MRPLAVVTGASRGIGRAIAMELAKTHEIVGTYRGAKDAADSLTAATGARMEQCDLASGEDRARLLATLEGMRCPALLVNNAGMAPRERLDILEAKEESFDEIINTNLKGPYFLTQAIGRRMLQEKAGRIAFITSISADTASVSRGDYCMSKAGLSMAASLFAARLSGEGIQVFEVRPGIIKTDMIAKVRDAYEARAEQLLPQKRLGEPEDIAKVVRAIADGLLDYCSGQVIQAAGGFHLRTL